MRWRWDWRAAWRPALDKPFEVVLDSRGGGVEGRVFGPDGALWSGANMALIPDPPKRAVTGVSRELG